jgi:hypothetical protein
LRAGISVRAAHVEQHEVLRATAQGFVHVGAVGLESEAGGEAFGGRRGRGCRDRRDWTWRHLQTPVEKPEPVRDPRKWEIIVVAKAPITLVPVTL